MTLPFLIIGALTAGSALAAMTLRNLVHCALCLVVTFTGLAALYLQLDAEFVGLAQILVYIGAVAILIVFAILLTRGTELASPAPIATAAPWAIAIAAATFVVISSAMNRSLALLPTVKATAVGTNALPEAVMIQATQAGLTNSTLLVIVPTAPPSVPVKILGVRMMEEFVVPLQVLGLLLTAAMIGAVIIALPEGSSARAASIRSGPDSGRSRQRMTNDE